MTDDQNEQPVLKDGNYTLTVNLAIPLNKTETKNASITRHFTISGKKAAPADVNIIDSNPAISGARRDLQRGLFEDIISTVASGMGQVMTPFTGSIGAIQAVFPPAGSLGDYPDVLPHIILRGSTLPWLRRAIADNNQIPWLALLLLDENENPGINTDDNQTVIDVRRDLLERILPSEDDLKYLAHVRQGTGPMGSAVIVGNRLPKPGSASIVHLVSMEGRYKDGKFDFQDTKEGDLIRLVSLYNWHFSCENRQQNFASLLMNLKPGTLRLPKNDNADAEKYLAMGCVPLQHTTWEKNQNISWYHGPLLPGENTINEPPRPIRDSAELMRFNQVLGLTDTSYAAAWVLGRLLALQCKAFSTELYNWKRSYGQKSQAQKLQARGRDLTHLPISAPAPVSTVPPDVNAWFKGVEQLKGIPFNYLVPDERMLPPESIRFFYLDWLWLECLQDGAFSLGQATKLDASLHAALPKPSRLVTGFLLRSDIVAGWPDLLVNGDGEASPWHMDRLSKDILICLFQGRLNAVDIHLKPEPMHFGVDGPDTGSTEFYILQETMGNKAKIVIPWHDSGLRVIHIGELAKSLKAATSVDFASQMIEPAERVRFIVNS
jgi:hypothetical protein